MISNTATPVDPGFRRSRRINTALLFLYIVYALLPLFYLIVTATKSNEQIFSTFGLWFSDTNNIVQNLRDMTLYRGGLMLRWLVNSVMYSLVSAVGATVICSAAGYAFAKFDFAGKDILSGVILVAMAVPQTVLVIPLFLLLSDWKLVDTPLAMILPCFVFAPGVFLMRSYIESSVPNELIDAGRVDGANEFVIFFRIAFRLFVPGFVTVFLHAYINVWNNYFLPLVVLNTPANYPVAVGLTNMYSQMLTGATNYPLYSLIAMGCVISVIPTLALFLFMQRYWQSGIAVGAVK